MWLNNYDEITQSTRRKDLPELLELILNTPVQESILQRQVQMGGLEQEKSKSQATRISRYNKLANHMKKYDRKPLEK